MRRGLLILALVGLVRLVVAALLPPFQDEAYYWVWSLRPAHLGVAFETVRQGPAVELTRSGERWSEKRIYLFTGWSGDSVPFETFRRPP